MSKVSGELRVEDMTVTFPSSDVIVHVERNEGSIFLRTSGSDLTIRDLVVRLPSRPSWRIALGLQAYEVGLNWDFVGSNWGDIPQSRIGVTAWTRGYSSTPFQIPALGISVETSCGVAHVRSAEKDLAQQSRWLSIHESGAVTETEALVIVALCLHGVFSAAAGQLSILAKLLGMGTESRISGMSALDDLFTLQARLSRKKDRFSAAESAP